MNGIISESSGKVKSFYGLSPEPIYAIIDKDLEAFEKTSVLKYIYSIKKSNRFAEKLTSKTSSRGFLPVDEGGAFPTDEFQEGFDKVYSHQEWKDGFSITRTMADDNKTLPKNVVDREFAVSYGRLREEFGAAILAGGIDGSISYSGKTFDCKTADKVSLFNTAHPSATKGTDLVQSNVYSNEFSADILGKLETIMQNFTDDNGRILSIAPDTIVIPNDATLKQKVFEAIGADKNPVNANNGFNYQYGRWNVIIWPYLNRFLKDENKSKMFILLDSDYNERVGGLVWFDRVPLEINNYIEQNTGNWKWTGYARFTAGPNNWRAVCAGGVTGGTELV